MQVKIKKCHPEAIIPMYQTDGAVAMDLHAIEDVFVPLGAIAIIDTGIALAIPEGFEGQIRPRSGLATKGITVVNSPGTIDNDFRSSCKVIIWNFGFGKDQDYEDANAPHGWKIMKGDRIAQLLIAPVVRAELIEVDELDETARGEGGFGSTGIR